MHEQSLYNDITFVNCFVGVRIYNLFRHQAAFKNIDLSGEGMLEKRARLHSAHNKSVQLDKLKVMFCIQRVFESKTWASAEGQVTALSKTLCTR